MNRKGLQEKYNILGNNDNISLYRKQGEYTRGIGYCGSISLKNGKAIFNNKSYNDIESLDKALREWEASLPWPVDTYNPLFRKGAALEDRIVWYLTDKLGFERSTSNWDLKYVKNVGPNCQIFFGFGSRQMDEETVTLVSQYGGVTFRSEFDDIDKAVDFISAIVRESVLQMSSDMVNLLSSLPDTKVPDIEAYVKSNKNIFGLEKVDFRGMMISLLENELKKLKKE